MRVYIDLDENIDNISELYAYIKTRDDKHIRVGGDIKLWAAEKTETVTEFADRCRECGARYGKLLEADKREGEK